MDSAKCRGAVGSGSPVTSHMPLVENRDVLRTLVAHCHTSTRLSLVQICPETKRSVIEAIRKDSKPPMAKMDTALIGTLPLIACDSAEVLSIAVAIFGATSCEQFIVCVSQCCALLFAKRDETYQWLVAVHCDDRQVAVVGWKQGAAECSQRPICNPITVKPTVAVSQMWETNIGNVVETMANCGDIIAVGTMHGANMALLNAHTGAIVTNALKGRYVAFLDEERVVGVTEEGRGKWLLNEFTANILTKEVPIVASDLESAKASANGKRLYVGEYSNSQLMEYCTDNWLLTARIALGGKPFGQCDVAANGLLAQGIKMKGDYSYRIAVIESNSRCVTQMIGTKHIASIRQVVFSPDSSRIASVARDESVQLFDAITGQMIGEVRDAHAHGHYLNSVCFLTDDWFVTISSDSCLVVWHCASQQPIARIEDAHHSFIHFVLRLSSDQFVTGDRNGSVKLWKLECK